MTSRHYVKLRIFLCVVSTFDAMIYYLSKNISHILIPQFMIDEWYPDMKWNIPMTILFI